MNYTDKIEAAQLSIFYNIDITMLTSLNELGLIEIETVNNVMYIPITFIGKLERYINYHQLMDINIAGIHAIENLLQRTILLQQQVTQLTNQLSFYKHK